MKLSIIIPSFNEEDNILNTLNAVQVLRKAGHEMILVDGGSTDRTLDLAQGLVDTIIKSEKGRAKQMNAGAKEAQGDILIFLHADTVLPKNIENVIIESLSYSKCVWGRFNVQLSGKSLAFRIIETLMNKRSCLTSIATGDQAIFIQKNMFYEINGFPEIPLMEDIEISKKLKHYSKAICIKERVITSSRRWEENGILRTVLLMWSIRLAWFFGISAEQLKKRYHA